MDPIFSTLPLELTLAAAISLVSLAGAGLPFYRGFRIFLRGRAATRRLQTAEMFEEANSSGIAPLSQRMMSVLTRSFSEHPEQSPDFVRDATRQFVLNDYDMSYARPLSMYSNILPPIGFIGTTLGMMVLFVSLQLSNNTLQIGALSVALSSTILALLGFAALEGCRIRLYARLMCCIDDVFDADLAAQLSETRRSA
ncbi:MAG: hypothetical protein GY725_01135 [bacterium]|nr:hypothetical protein [bacterium]